jgi:precorrin-8X/cobalt-precorrin-8 methylmutase
MTSRTLFDAYVVVDWSANTTPKAGKDSIWIAEAVRAGRRLTMREPANPRTRDAAHAHLSKSLAQHVAARRRVLIGFDFAYTFPRGFADALALDRSETRAVVDDDARDGTDARWRRVWRALSDTIHDDATNANNRFAVAAALNRRLGRAPGPFWNCPRAAACRTLAITKGAFPYVTRGKRALAEYRMVDLALRRSGRIVQSVWKLFTTGSVGSQTLLGIPRVQALRDEPTLAPVSRVWPLETGFTSTPSPATGAFVLHAEMWPGIVAPIHDDALVRDARQVMTLAQHFADLDDTGKLAPLFERPASLTDDEIAICYDEEGWTLGA